MFIRSWRVTRILYTNTRGRPASPEEKPVTSEIREGETYFSRALHYII